MVISGANTGSYTPVDDDVGYRLRALVIYEDVRGGWANCDEQSHISCLLSWDRDAVPKHARSWRACNGEVLTP